MVNISLPRDNNRIAVIGGTSSSDGITPTTIYVDPTTHRVLVDNASGTGDVVGPASAVDSNFASFNTTTGKLIKDSGYSPSSFVPYTGATTDLNLGLHDLFATHIGSTGSRLSNLWTDNITCTNAIVADITGNAGTVTNGVYTTDVTITPTASKIVKRDANGNIFFNNYFANSASTVSAGGTTVLTVASARYQALTGSLSQTFQLPDATTLAISSIFTLNNNSSGTLVLKNNGGTTIYTVPAGGYVQAEPIDISTANGTWEILPYAPSTVTWGSGTAGLIMNSVLSTTPTIGAGASSATVPVFIPQRGASTTGFGGDGTNLHAIIGGATSTTFNSTGLSVGTSGVVTTGTIELGHATDTTLSRVSAGVLAVEGVVIPSISSTNTFTNKRINPRLVTTTSYTTDTGTSLDVSTCDQFEITAQAGALLFNAPSGTPLGGQKLIIRIKDNGTARALTYNAIFRAMGNALPSTTVLSKTLYMGFIYNFTDSKWDLVAVAQES